MRDLYAVEAQARADGVDLDELLRRRQRDSRPLVDCLHHIIGDLAGRVTPKSPLGKAVAYAVNQWSTLIVFLEDPRVPLSNTHVERQQHRAAIGRRNFLFAGSDDGARRFAMLHTLIVNCDLVGAPPFEYLRDVFGRLADDWPKARLHELLPAAWLADQRRQQQLSDRAADAVADAARPSAGLRAALGATSAWRSSSSETATIGRLLPDDIGSRHGASPTLQAYCRTEAPAAPTRRGGHRTFAQGQAARDERHVTSPMREPAAATRGITFARMPPLIGARVGPARPDRSARARARRAATHRPAGERGDR